jgi:hypothetical protein
VALRHFLMAVAGAAAFSFTACAAPPTPVSAYLPTTCQPGVPSDCVRATPVTNPDGSNISGGGGGGGGDASAANQTSVQAVAGSDASKATAIQGITGGKAISVAFGSALPAGENHIGAFGGNLVVVGGSVTRPANTTAYASGQLVANSTTAGSVTPITIAGAARVNAGTGAIAGVRLSTSSTNLTSASFRVHFFKVSPTVANGDGAALSANVLGATEIGYVDVTVDVAGSDGAKGSAAPARNLLYFDTGAATTSLYALIEARGAYTPTSAEVLTVAAEILQN